MQRSQGGGRALTSRIADWRFAVLIAACVAGGLTLTVMVIGPDPAVIVEASPGTTALPAAGSTVAPDPPVTVTDAVVAATEVPPAAADESIGPIDAVAPATAARTVAVVAAPVGAPASSVRGAPTVAPSTATTSAAPSTAPAPSGSVAPSSTSAPATTAAPAPTIAPPPSVTTSPPVVAFTYPTFNASGSGVVTLAFDGSAISVASVTPQTNWVFDVEKNGPRSVEVKFFNTATQQEAEFHAAVEGGRIKVED